LIHHGVDGVLQLENLTFYVHGDLARQITASNGCGHVGDIADLAGEVGGHGVDIVREVFPGTRYARHGCLTAKYALCADFPRYTRNLRGKSIELVDHRVDGIFEFENLTTHVDGDLLGKIAIGHGNCHLSDVANLAGEIGSHRVDVVREILPSTRHTGHCGLPAELAVGTDLAGYTGDLGGESIELVNHGIDGVLQREDFALHVHGNLAGKIAPGHGGGHFRDVAHLTREVGGHGVDGIGEILPGTRHAGHRGLPAELAFRADFARHPGYFR